MLQRSHSIASRRSSVKLVMLQTSTRQPKLLFKHVGGGQSLVQNCAGAEKLQVMPGCPSWLGRSR